MDLFKLPPNILEMLFALHGKLHEIMPPRSMKDPQRAWMEFMEQRMAPQNMPGAGGGSSGQGGESAGDTAAAY